MVFFFCYVRAEISYAIFINLIRTRFEVMDARKMRKKKWNNFHIVQHPWWWRQWHVMSTKFSLTRARENCWKACNEKCIVASGERERERENLSKCFTKTSSIIKSTFGNYFPRNLMSMWCGGVVVCCWVHLLNIALSNAAYTNKYQRAPLLDGGDLKHEKVVCRESKLIWKWPQQWAVKWRKIYM